MKLLITSPDALVDSSTGKPFPGIMEQLAQFTAIEDHTVAVLSIHRDKLKDIPREFNPINIKASLRGSPKLIEYIKADMKIDSADIFVLGCKMNDVHQAANSKLLLLRADYAKVNNAADKIYTKEYGIPIRDANSLGIFFERFLDIDSPWYFKLTVDDKTTAYALTNANTWGKGGPEVDLSEKFKLCLKKKDDSYRTEFMIYFLVSSYRIMKEFESVDYWGIYPSSTTEANEDLDFFKEKVRQSFNGKIAEPILIRHSDASKRQGTPRDKRISNGCNDQLDTIVLNEVYRGHLAGSTVCIIDDFTTYGTSCETSRALLSAAGVSKIIFIALGKFGSEYFKYDYQLSGDPFGKFSYKVTTYKALIGTFNSKANLTFVESLASIIK